jgi:hypothetical protein
MKPQRSVTSGKPDPWLERYLEIIGRANPDGIGAGIRASYCPRCKRTILAGLDADVAALPVRLHPAQLTAHGEAAALLLGIPTYALLRRATRLEARLRDTAAIRQRPPSIIAVHAEHRCGFTLPAHLYRPAPKLAPLPDTPPF